MILTLFHGFCMALADSVPGVSGGTVAFILGFYERFLDALHALLGPGRTARRAALRYLFRLGLGWCAGMAGCVAVLSGLFEQNIYFMSSLFLGLTVCAIPFVVLAERPALRDCRSAVFLLLGAAAVVGLTLLRAHTAGAVALNYAQLRWWQYLYLFVSGAAAISAMVLPGISGSSLLLIAGVYLPTLQAIRSLLLLHLAVLPGLCALGLGILAGIVCSIHAIRNALQTHRSPMVWLILGLMLGSLYAIANGPASLSAPLPPLTLGTFQPAAFLLGCGLLLALELLKRAVPGAAPQNISAQKEVTAHEF